MGPMKSEAFGKDSPKAGENSNYMAKGLNYGPLDGGDFEENGEFGRRFVKSWGKFK